MTWGEYELKILEKELSEKEGQLIKVLSINGNHITICNYAQGNPTAPWQLPYS